MSRHKGSPVLPLSWTISLCCGEGVVEDLLEAGWLVARQVQTVAGCYPRRQVGWEYTEPESMNKPVEGWVLLWSTFYSRVRIFSWLSLSPCSMPTMVSWWLGRPLDVGEDVRGGVVSNKVIIAHAGAVLVFHGGGKDVGGGVVSGKASLAHAGAIVADQSINVSAQILMCWSFLDSGETGPEE